MDVIVVNGGNQLNGEVEIDGSKNAVLPILAGTILGSNGVTKLSNVPNLSDVHLMSKVLNGLGVKVKYDENADTMELVATGNLSHEASFDFVSKMRASIVVMGPLLTRLGKATVAMPGGCAIGSRPIDIHLKGFEQMGAEIEMDDGYVKATAPNGLHGASIYLDFPSVGGTQNLMMAAILAEGETMLENAAQEPEIVDLANFLNKMGAKIYGAGTEKIIIKGVSSLKGAEHAVIQDRIEAGTYMIAAAAAGGKVLVKDADSLYNRPLISKLTEMGVDISIRDDGILIESDGQLKPTNVTTVPYPGFPTDLQAPMTIIQLLADGVSEMAETVFENRFMHLDELRRMNANFEIKGQTVFLKGPAKFKGAAVSATDLRAAAALIIAGLTATGKTQIDHLEYLDRGYYKITNKLQKLGAKISRETI